MNRVLRPKFLFITGGILVIIGFIVPFLMILDIVPKWLWLELLIGAFQMIGLVAGIMGSVIYVKENRK